MPKGTLDILIKTETMEGVEKCRNCPVNSMCREYLNRKREMFRRAYAGSPVKDLFDFAAPERRIANSLKERTMQTGKSHKVKSILEMFESLNKSVKKAGGMPFSPKRAAEMSFLDAVEALAPNGIRFYRDKDAVSTGTLKEIEVKLAGIRANYTNPDKTDRQRREEMDNLLAFIRSAIIAREGM